MILRFSIILLLGLSAGLAWAWQDYQAFVNRPIVVEKPLILDVVKGSSFRGIINRLSYQTPRVHSIWFRVLAHQEGMATRLKAGEYELPVGLKPKEFLLLLSKGQTRKYTITFPEGWTFKQLRQALAVDKNLKLTLAKLSDADILQKIGSEYTHPEGLFFPDTYQYEKGEIDLAILQRAYQKMQGILAVQWANKMEGLPLTTAYEALILASIVEKETGNPSERPIIAGVFIRRLKKGMRLQTDPTVIYGMGENYQGNIRKKDLRELTAYNTYRIMGLPPTPIAMPGEEAINAVLHPAQDNSLYFVAKGNGSHIFSATLADHNRAVDTFQRKRK